MVVGRGSRASNLFMGNICFQIDASFQNGEEYVQGEEEMYKEKEMLLMG